MNRLSLLICLLTLGACNPSLSIDAEGYFCRDGNDCPVGYACTNQACHAGTVDPGCAGVQCTNTPEATCSGGNTLRTFAGVCAAGQCSYPSTDVACAAGCSNGACLDACAGVVCDDAPMAACSDASTLRTFAQTGTCANGRCSYETTDIACPNGCTGAVCQGVDLCAMNQVTCTMPPAPTCNGSSRRVYAPSGTCAPGTGLCTYAPTDSACPNGCALGQCLTASLTFSQVGPRLHFAANAIDVAPSSSGNLALAVGNDGKVAWWDGAAWAELTTPSTRTLSSVAFVNSSTAYVVGQGGTAFTVRPAQNQLTTVALPDAGVNLVAVSGRSDQEVLIAGAQGSFWRLRSGSWSANALPSASGPYVMGSAYLDESLRERIAGQCGTSRCVAYRFPSGATPDAVIHTQTGTPGFTALGGNFTVPMTATTSDALVGRGDNALFGHTTQGFTTGTFFPAFNVSPALVGNGVVGITAQANTVGTRDLFVLTQSGPNIAGHLYRVTRGVTSFIANDALTVLNGEEHLSPSDANGVLVASVRRAQNLTTVFRRGTVTNEALDVGEDFVGASVDDQGTLVLATPGGDLVTRDVGETTFAFRRPPARMALKDLEARNGLGVLLVGADAIGAGVVLRVTSAGFNTISGAGLPLLRKVCRVSDTEGWAVGNGGTVLSISGTTVTPVTVPTTADLFDVDCAAGAAVACGANGTVLRLAGGTWTQLPSAGAATLTACRMLGSASVIAGGDNVLSRFDFGAWSTLAAKPALTSLIVVGAQEIYGAYGTTNSTVARFDGAAWNPPLLTVSGLLGGGVQAEGRVVWGGTLGAIVDGR